MPDQQLPAGLLDADAAYATVYQRVYAPRFFEKLAAAPYGIKPATDEEALQLLTMGTRLRQAYDADQEKQAAARGSQISGALSALEQRLGATPDNSADERFRKQSSANGSRDPELARAILSLQILADQSRAA